ncbi:MAG: hypothetical protein IPF96_13715 [Rhodobacter sp.]|nr:hypothetical protein [Rhodobacter sp.]
MTEAPRVPLYDRLPEIYRIRDAAETPPGMLAAYLRGAEAVLGAVQENIEALHDDLFVETCDDWVVPYIADLLGSARHRPLDPADRRHGAGARSGDAVADRNGLRSIRLYARRETRR